MFSIQMVFGLRTRGTSEFGGETNSCTDAANDPLVSSFGSDRVLSINSVNANSET